MPLSMARDASDRWPKPNLSLLRERRRRGWSQDDVADGLSRSAAELGEPHPGIDRNTVSRWERGIRHPRPRYVRLLCHLFRLPTEELGFMEEDFRKPGSRKDPAQFDLAPTLLGARRDSLTAMLEGLQGIDAAGLDDLSAVVHDLQRQCDSDSPHELLRRVRWHIASVRAKAPR